MISLRAIDKARRKTEHVQGCSSYFKLKRNIPKQCGTSFKQLVQELENYMLQLQST